MEKLHFTTIIEATPEKVWDTLWNDKTYPEWTAPFGEGSRAETDWNEGSKVLFLSAGGDGMSSRIAVKRPNEFMSFEHLGFVKDGKEDYDSDEVKKWSGAREEYTLTPVGGNTEVRVDMDMAESYKSYFEETFPKAMERLKAIAENK